MEEVQLRPIRIEDFKQLSYTRLNHHYKKPHLLAELILRNLGLLDFRRQKTSFVVPYFTPMFQIFENFLTQLFKDYYGMTIRDQVSTQSWKVDNISRDIRPDIISYDSTIPKKGSEVSIIDAKYMPASKFGEDKEHFQIAFYLNEYNKKVGYAIVPKEKNEKRDMIRWEAPNQNLTIYVKFIDIDQTLDWIYSKENNTKMIKYMLHNLVPEYPDVI